MSQSDAEMLQKSINHMFESPEKLYFILGERIPHSPLKNPKPSILLGFLLYVDFSVSKLSQCFGESNQIEIPK